jgi:hypothetical protein
LKLLLTLLISISYLGCTAPEKQTLSANGGTYSASLSPAKWPSNSVFPISLKLSNDFAANELAAINNSANAWSDSVGNQLNFFNTVNQNISEKSSLGSYEDSIYGVYKVFSWPSSLPSSALAVTQIRGIQKSSSITITHADILINYDYFSFTTDGSWGYDLETVILHELGHFLGLYHDNTAMGESVMYPTISRYSDNKAPKASDSTTLRAKYGLSHSASSTARSLIPATNNDSEEIGKEIIIQLELYPNQKEVIKINGVIHEEINLNHHHL